MIYTRGFSQKGGKVTFLELLAKTNNDYSLTVKIFTVSDGETFSKDWSFAQWVEVFEVAWKNRNNLSHLTARKELIPRAKTYQEWRVAIRLTHLLHVTQEEEEREERDKILDEMYSSVSNFDECMDFLRMIRSIGLGPPPPNHPIHKFKLGILEKVEKFTSTFEEWDRLHTAHQDTAYGVPLVKMEELASTFEEWLHVFKCSYGKEAIHERVFKKLVELSR